MFSNRSAPACLGEGFHFNTNASIDSLIPDRRISPQRDYLAQLATETVFEIVRFLPLRSMALLATLSNRLHDISTHVLYRDVHVDDHRTRRFILTMLSQCRTSKNYPSLVRRLTFIVRPSVTVCLGYSILSQSLLKMQNLEALGIFMPSSCSDTLIVTMKNIGLMQEKSSALTQKGETDEENPRYLPRLRELSLTGNNDLAKLCNSRRISTLRVLEPMSGTELIGLTNDLEPEVARGVQCLDVRILSLRSRELFCAMASIDKAFPNITHFGLQAGYMNALASAILFFAIHKSNSSPGSLPDDLTYLGKPRRPVRWCH